MARPYPAVTCHVGVNGGLYVFEPPAGSHRYTSRAALQLRSERGADWAPLRTLLTTQNQSRALPGLAPLQSRTDSEVISPAAMAGGNTGLVLCQVGGQCPGQ